MAGQHLLSRNSRNKYSQAIPEPNNMRAYHITIAIALLVGIVTSSVVILAQAPFQPPYFAFNPESRSHLTYYVIENRFDSAYVSLTVGEFALRVGSNVHRLQPRTDSLHPSVYFQADSVQGRDNLLASVLRTSSFEIPSEPTSVSFFRMARAKSTCSSTGTGGSSSQPQTGDSPASILDWHFKPGKDVLLDDTWFTIELVRASDDSVLTVLDSTGMRNKPNSRFADVYGTFPFSVYRTVALPSSMLGVVAYLRVVPHRTGPTPYGCTAHLYSSWLNLSATNGYFVGEPSIMNHNDVRRDTLDAQYWTACLSYYDGLLATNGCVLPQQEPQYMISQRHDSIFRHRYYDSVAVSSYDSNTFVVYPRPCTSSGKSIGVASNQHASPESIDAVRVSVARARADHLSLRIDAVRPLSAVTVRIVSVSDARVVSAKTTRSSSSLLETDVAISDLPIGAYVVQVVTNDGRGAQCPIHVVR